MQKKVIALSVAAAVAAPGAVSAAPTMYGQMHSSFDWIDDDNNGDSDDFVTAPSRNSRIGLKGSENLGVTLKAIWQAELELNWAEDNGDTGGGVDFRNTFLGLSGNWGSIIAGRHDTPYRIATDELDLFDDRIGDMNNIIGATSGSPGTELFDLRAPQTVAYITPNWRGFHAAAAYIEHKFNEETLPGYEDFCTQGDFLDPDRCRSDDENRAFSIMGMWDNETFFLSGAYELHKGNAFQLVTEQNFVGGLLEEGFDPADPFFTERDSEKIYAYKFGAGWRFERGQINGVFDAVERCPYEH